MAAMNWDRDGRESKVRAHYFRPIAPPSPTRIEGRVCGEVRVPVCPSCEEPVTRAEGYAWCSPCDKAWKDVPRRR